MVKQVAQLDEVFYTADGTSTAIMNWTWGEYGTSEGNVKISN